MTSPRSAARPSAGFRPSPFTGLDVCEAAGLTVRPGGKRPKVGDLVWDFSDVEGMPVHVRPFQLTMRFEVIRDPRWRVAAQDYLFARMAPGHELVRPLPRAFRVPIALPSLHGRLREATAWFNWLTTQGVTSLGEVAQELCEGYRLHRSVVRDRDGVVLRPTDATTHMMSVLTVQELTFYNEVLGGDRFTPGFLPWNGRAAFEIAGGKHDNENVTQPLRQEALQPWLAAALYVVTTLGPHLVALRRELGQEPGWQVWTSAEHRDERYEAVIREHMASGVPLGALSPVEQASRLNEGWSEDDPLLEVNLNLIARRAGKAVFPLRFLAPVRPLLEQAVSQVGVRPRWGRDAPSVPRADGAGQVPWTEGVCNTTELRHLTERFRTACAVVVALLTGMRASELMAMPLDARVEPKDLGGGRKRYRLRTKLIKGRKELGGVWDEWVTVAEAYDAVGLAVDLLDPEDDPTRVFGRLSFTARCNSLRAWVNGPEGRRLGLAPIPDDSITLRITRRTLAMELAHRPGGLLAAKIHLKHVSVVTTEGYAARPGGAQAKFLADVAAEERDRNRQLTLAAFRDSQNGIMPTGPGAKDLISFFASVDEKLRQMTVAAPGVRPGDQEVINLLARRAGSLHLGTANYCWFTDPSKALCLAMAGTPAATKPLAGMCDSTRCPQATHHPCHRPVWASSAENKKTFIGAIGRGQKTEKARLQADLDRDLRVLAEIDAATGTGA